MHLHYRNVLEEQKGTELKKTIQQKRLNKQFWILSFPFKAYEHLCPATEGESGIQKILDKHSKTGTAPKGTKETLKKFRMGIAEREALQFQEQRTGLRFCVPAQVF